MNNVFYYDNENWAKLAACTLADQIYEIIKLENHCNLMLTGGRSAEILYSELSKIQKFTNLKSRINFYFSDDKCVDVKNNLSNYGMACRKLFKNTGKLGNVHRIKVEGKNKKKIIDDYSKVVPDNLHILILSIGDDGHIASIFPNSNLLFNTKDKIGYVVGENGKPDRVTVLPKVIKSADNIFLMCLGDTKKIFHNMYLRDDQNFKKLPCFLASHGYWIVSK